MREIKYLSGIALALIVVITPAVASAAEGVAHTTIRNFSALGKLRDAVHTARAGKQKLPGEVRFNADIAGLGITEFVIQSKVIPTWPATITDANGTHPDTSLASTVLLQGVASVPGHRSKHLPVAGSFVDGVFKVSLFNAADHKRYELTTFAKDGADATATVDRTRIPEKEFVCMAHAAESDTKPAASAESPSTAAVSTESVRIIEVSTDADTSWYNKYGSNSNSTIATIVNEAATIYEDQLSLTFQIKQQNVFSTSDPYAQTGSEELLVEFKNYTNTNGHLGSADVYHLFTDVDLGGTSDATIGIAYVGVICAYPTFIYGLTEDSPGKHAVVFAHEVGHNLNAGHDTSTPITIMYPAIPDTPPTNFSSSSTSAITSFVSSYGSCLAVQGGGSTPTPTPTPTSPGGGGDDDSSGETPTAVTLTTAFSKGTLTATMTLDAANPECTLRLRASTNQSKVLSGKILYQGPADSTTVTLVGTNKSKVSTSTKVYLAAQLVCPVTFGSSFTKTLKVSASSASSLSIGKWLNGLARDLEVQEAE